MHAAQLFRVFLVLALGGCGGGQKPPPQRPPSPPPAKAAQRIEGQIAHEEEEQRRKRMQIWGQVKLLMDGEYAELPPLSSVDGGGAGDPVTEISNQTDFRLTVWFAGKCAHQVDVPPKSNITALFCPGLYQIAAVVQDGKFLPLIRENQDFKAGVSYRLEFFIQQPPH